MFKSISSFSYGFCLWCCSCKYCQDFFLNKEPSISFWWIRSLICSSNTGCFPHARHGSKHLKHHLKHRAELRMKTSITEAFINWKKQNPKHIPLYSKTRGPEGLDLRRGGSDATQSSDSWLTGHFTRSRISMPMLRGELCEHGEWGGCSDTKERINCICSTPRNTHQWGGFSFHW